MKRSILCTVAVMATSIAASVATADTRNLTSTVYLVNVSNGEQISLPKGGKVATGLVSHGTVVDKETGEVSSQWCSGAGFEDSAGKPTNALGSCTVFSDNGDMLWLAFLNGAMDQPNTWTVLGGTGQNAGATGGGSCTLDSQRSDGSSSTATCTGKINTK
jgi:hypothetical protein